jgi:hypothetical protein
MEFELNSDCSPRGNYHCGEFDMATNKRHGRRTESAILAYEDF